MRHNQSSTKLYEWRGWNCTEQQQQRNLGCGEIECQLGLLSTMNQRPLHPQGGEPRAISSTKAMENQESPKTCVLVSLFLNSVQDQVSGFFANDVVAMGIVISSCSEWKSWW